MPNGTTWMDNVIAVPRDESTTTASAKSPVSM